MTACFNCQKTDGVQSYSFDMDLPTVNACANCIFALSMGDDELLRALRPSKAARLRQLRAAAKVRVESMPDFPDTPEEIAERADAVAGMAVLQSRSGAWRSA